MRGWGALAALVSLVVTNAPAAAAGGGEWLDARVPAQWNEPGARVPRPPRFDPDPFLEARCKAQDRTPSSEADRAVVRAGWKLFGACQHFGDTEVVTARSGSDGMCRPLGFQSFVFVGGKFAGTLSPRPMDARTDGAGQVPELVAADAVVLVFSRYAMADPMCCPSRTSTAQYRVAGGPQRPVVRLTAVSTQPTGDAAPPAVPASIALRTWQLTRMESSMDDGILVPDHPSKYTLELGGDGRATVKADCNRGSGAYHLDGRSLSLGPFVTTRATCPPGSLADRYLAQLAQVAAWAEKDGKLRLTTRADGAVLEFQPAPGADGVLSGAERCRRSGGTVEAAACCGLVGEFPNTCLVGACGCSPEASRPVSTCRCPAGQCFDGSSCAPVGRKPGGQLR